MTVKELISVLTKYDPDLRVNLNDEGLPYEATSVRFIPNMYGSSVEIR